MLKQGMTTWTATTRSRPGAGGAAISVQAAARSVRVQHLQAALEPSLAGRRAAAWVPIWDKAAKSSRLHLLQAFYTLHSESNSSAMERDMGDAAPLLFTRITSWLKLTYKTLARDADKSHKDGATEATIRSTVKPTPLVASKDTARQTGGGPASGESVLLLLVRAITIFTRGAPYLTQLVESGVTATLCDCLETGSRGLARRIVRPLPVGGADVVCSTELDTTGAAMVTTLSSPYAALSTAERKAVVLLLLYIANAGRVYREMITEEHGLHRLFTALRRERDGGTAGLLTELFIALGQGRPRIIAEVHIGLVNVILAHRKAELLTSSDPAAIKLAAVSGLVGATAVGDESETVSALWAEVVEAEVVLQAARALRTLQIMSETHHLHSKQQVQQQQQDSDGGEDVDAERTSGRGAAQRGLEALDTVPVIGVSFAQQNYTETEIDPTCPIIHVARRRSCTGDDGAAACSRYDRSDDDGDGRSGEVDGDAEGRTPPDSSISADVYLTALLHLTTHPTNTRFRVEGNELLTLAAKNLRLMRLALAKCLDALDDDLPAVADEDDIETMQRRQRGQMSCGRAAVQIILTEPRSAARTARLLQLVALRGAHLTLLKYLRLADNSDTAAVVDCCRALQILARASNDVEQMREQGTRSADKEGDTATSVTGDYLCRVGQSICDIVGDPLYQILLYQDMTEEEANALLRAARASASNRT